MDSLGLSLFQPDFIITSVYKVFGYDRTGFGRLFMISSRKLQLQNQHSSSGIVKISSVCPRHLSYSFGKSSISVGEDEDVRTDEVLPENHARIQLPAFSGVINPSLVRNEYETEKETREFVGVKSVLSGATSWTIYAAASLRHNPLYSMTAATSLATVSRIMASPLPIAEMAQYLLAYVPAPMMGVSPILPDILLTRPPVEVAAARFLRLSTATHQTVLCLLSPSGTGGSFWSSVFIFQAPTLLQKPQLHQMQDKYGEFFFHYPSC